MIAILILGEISTVGPKDNTETGDISRNTLAFHRYEPVIQGRGNAISYCTLYQQVACDDI